MYGQNMYGMYGIVCTYIHTYDNDVVRVCMMYDVWMYGCMDVWMYGCMDVWMYGCMDVWTYGCMDVWTYGRMDVWMYGCKYGCMEEKKL